MVCMCTARAGFLSIDCGLDDQYSGYEDPSGGGGIVYVSDGHYTDAGENLKVGPEYGLASWLTDNKSTTYRVNYVEATIPSPPFSR
nr:unnamed protein product [Digitaria exilis]